MANKYPHEIAEHTPPMGKEEYEKKLQQKRTYEKMQEVKMMQEAKEQEAKTYSNLGMGMVSKFASKKELKRSAVGNSRCKTPPVEEDTYPETYACEGEDLAIDGEAAPIASLNNSGSFTDKPKFQLKDRPIMADTTPTLPALPEDIDLLRKEVCFERVNEKICVVMVAIDRKHHDKNKIESIKANGDPLGGYAYTAESDNYLINCCGFAHLGIVPMAFRLSVPGCAGKQLLPLTESLVQKHASPPQRKMIRHFKEKYPECDVHFVQSLSRS